jgi:hypothetical protein
MSSKVRKSSLVDSKGQPTVQIVLEVTEGTFPCHNHSDSMLITCSD